MMCYHLNAPELSTELPRMATWLLINRKSLEWYTGMYLTCLSITLKWHYIESINYVCRILNKDRDENKNLEIREIHGAHRQISELLNSTPETKNPLMQRTSKEISLVSGRSNENIKRPSSDQPLTRIESEESSQNVVRRSLESNRHIRTAPNINKEQSRNLIEKLESSTIQEVENIPMDTECTCMKTDKGVNSNWQYRKFCKCHKKYTYY